MNVQPTSQINFKGYDVRPLRGFFMQHDCCGIAKEMKAIGDKEGFRIFSPHKNAKSYQITCSETLPVKSTDTLNLWAQDRWMIVKNKLLAYDLNSITNSIKEFFNLSFCPTQQELRNKMSTPIYNASSLSFFASLEAEERAEEFIAYKKEIGELRDACHISGGNVFIVKNDKKDSVIVGSNELHNFSLKEIKKMFDTNSITVLPQMDFHLDLFIRPLDNKRILLTDDIKSLEVLQNGINKISQYIKNNPNDNKIELLDILQNLIEMRARLQAEVQDNPFAQTDNVESILKKAGFEVIRVPGRLYQIAGTNSEEPCLQHYCNYMNANVLRNKDGEIVYITNKGMIDKMLGLSPELSDKLNFSFEGAFIDSISPYVKKEHIYFIEGENDAVANEMLFLNQGGIHCACMEIPE